MQGKFLSRKTLIAYSWAFMFLKRHVWLFYMMSAEMRAEKISVVAVAELKAEENVMWSFAEVELKMFLI